MDSNACPHSEFVFGTYIEDQSWRPSKAKRLAALPSDKEECSKAKGEDFPRTSYPAPQVLPGDCLDSEAFEVEAEAQSYQKWRYLGVRNTVTSRRRTLYVVPPPIIGDSVKVMNSWKEPKVPKGRRGEVAVPPAVDDVTRYIKAFFSPLPVKQLPQFEFTQWPSDGGPKNPKKQKVSSKKSAAAAVPEICLVDRDTDMATRITTRPGGQEPFARQLSTNDLIDTLIASVPGDAFAVVMLLEHDLYEDEGDDFIIGRAFGGSHVCVVTTARYNTYLDEIQDIPTDHSWPMTYCAEFVKSQGLKVPKSDISRPPKKAPNRPLPILSALNYEREHKSTDPSTIWLFKQCRTTVHELLHCFGVGHCIYYGCMMQSTSNSAEDARQPPYLCPVDHAKLLSATGCDELQWYVEIEKVSRELGPEGGFGALAVWCSARAAELQKR